MKSENRVCALIVTYNRRELLRRNVDSLLKQKETVDILIYDNASPDKPVEYLIENGYDVKPINPDSKETGRIMAYSADSNTGGAGGFSRGINLIYSLGYEYIWLMDDDGYCLNEDTLGILLTHSQDEKGNIRKAIFNSLVICKPLELQGDDTLSFTLFGERKLTDAVAATEFGNEDRVCRNRDHEKTRELYGEISSFNSTFFHRNLVETIGSVNEEYFIYGDDTDYLERAINAGYDLITVIDSRYFHPDSGMGYRRFMGRMVAMRNMSLRNTYLYTRNYMYIMKKYRTRKQAWLHIPKVLVKCFLYKEQRFKKTIATILGIMDGWHERLGHPEKFGY